MSGTLPRYRSTERIQGNPIVNTDVGGGGAMAALSRSMSQLQQTITGAARDIADVEGERRFGEARRDALTAPIRDEAGNYTVPEPDFSTRTGRMSAETYLGRIIDEETIAARERAVRVRAEVGGDPEQFQARWVGDIQGRLPGLPEFARERVGQVLRQVGVEHINAQRMDVVQRQARLTEAGWRDVLGALNSDLEGLARGGRFEGPEYQQTNQRLIEHLDRGVREGFISPETRRVTLDTVIERVGSQTVFRSALDRLDGGASADEVVREFEAEADRRALPPGSRSNLRGMLRTAINEHQARQALARSELRGELEDWTRVSASGVVPFDPAAGVRLAERAEAAGDTALAARIRRTQQAFIEVSSAASGSLGDIRTRQQALIEEMRQAQAPEVQAGIFDRLQALREMEQARVRQMRDDPFGTAARVHRGKPGVGEVAPLDFSDVERLGTQLQQRAGVARVLGGLEGMGETMPVVSAAEAAQLSSVIREGSHEQQIALLTAFASMPADTMRRTMEGLLPGQENERDPRVLSFMAAAGLTQRDPRLALETLRGAERLRTTPAPALSGPLVDRTIEQRIGEAYGVNPAAYAAIREAARAIYAERAATGLATPATRVADDRPGLVERGMRVVAAIQYAMPYTAQPPQVSSTRPNETRNAPALTAQFNPALMHDILDQIAPQVMWRGQRLPAPIRDGLPLTPNQFAETLAAMPTSALNGARAADGRPVTADMVRRDGVLIPVGQGRYEVMFHGYRVAGANARSTVIDMNQPWRSDDDFRRRLRAAEGGGDPARMNGEGFLGLYQFGTERLQELGLYSPAAGEGRNGWRGVFNIPGHPEVRTVDDFRRSAAAQEAAADLHFTDIDRVIEMMGAVGGRDRNGLRAVAHLGGVNGMRRFVATNGGYDPADSNGTKLSAYYRRFSGL